MRPIAISTLAQSYGAKVHRERMAQRYGQPVLPQILKSPTAVEAWPQSKQLAILMIYRSGFALDCIAHLNGSGVRAGQEDFASLRDEDLAFRRELARFHELTETGQRYAEQAAMIVAKRLGLHHVRHGLPGNRHASAKCTCGWSCSFDERFGLTRPKIDRAISEHLRGGAGANGGDDAQG